MAVKHRNVFKEASRRLRDFKARGFVPKGSKYAYQDFVNEVVAENRGEDYKGAYTAKAYEEAYGTKVSYYTDETYQDIANYRLDNLVDKYKQELVDIFHTNDFYELCEKYGRNFGFHIHHIDNISTLDELIGFTRSAQNIQPFLFRNKNGRNRRDESGMMETYHNEFLQEMNRLVQEMNAAKMKFTY